MRSINASFATIAKAHPAHSTYICFVKAVKARGYSIRAISRAFKKLVDKDDYDPMERNSIIRELYMLSMNDKKSFHQGYTKSEGKEPFQKVEKQTWIPTHVGAFATL